MATVDKRILIRMRKELTDLEQTPPLGVACYPVNDNIVHLQADIAGPEDSPYHGGSFKIDIHIPDRYPFEPPRCQFLTRVYHPNIDEQGLICLDILKGPPKGTWLPSINITTMLISLQLLLAQPNPDDPLLVDVATEFKENRELFKYKAREFTKKYAVGTHGTNESNSGPDEKTRLVGLKDLESVLEESDSLAATPLSRSSPSPALRASTPVITTALSLKTESSAPVSASTERISLARPTHKKLTLSRRPTPSVAASAASVLSAPFVAPRRKASVDQGAVVGSLKDSLATRELTTDKVNQEESTSATHLAKEEPVSRPVHISQSRLSSQQSSYPSLQDTIPATNTSSPQNLSPDNDTTTTASLETEATKADRKRGAESIKNEEPTAETAITTKKIKSLKKLMLGSKPLKRPPSPAKETLEYFPGSLSPLLTPVKATPATSTREPIPPPPTSPVESTAQKLALSLQKRKSSPLSTIRSPPPALGAPTSTVLSNLFVQTPSDSDTPATPVQPNQSTTPRSPAISTANSPQPRSQELSGAESSIQAASPLTTITSTGPTPKVSGVTEEMSPREEALTQEPELRPLSSPNISDTSENPPPVSPYNKNKGKSKAIDDVKMDVDTRDTDQSELMNMTAYKRQDNAFSFMDDLSPTVTTTGSTAALTVAKKRNLLKKNRK
ncbi:Ubiquitin-conjugating enzyme E2 T [Linnemannia schmuckeri]|uniref:E2 ubiquitin-conjugating enzyme n=1 Tax=Linnemannia schmuckeri TaxID=64567 RepID=A0A9P5RNM4_9FUNG|nr:Ubiquitin-conjugating enzyme E2 T [Linnemannia schmuckeri]